ncbi:MAG: peptidoglycan editing factor PgeF [Helicobacteraceae bacterium]|jgi:YfiH family protein|nr:peptidoglycan editing factor PgeF [Helicobacteraceae bacterium]
MLQFAMFDNQPSVIRVVTTRLGGVSLPPFDSLNLGANVGDDPKAISRNRAAIADVLGAQSAVYMNQIHSDRVVAIDKAPQTPPECDAIITNAPNIALAVLSADCVPILLFDAKTRAIGAAHAGWRGTASMIVIKTIEAMREAYGSNPSDLSATIAPAICGRCYKIGDEVANAWRRLPPYLQPALNGDRLDLPLANRLQLTSVGVLERNIETIAKCTFEDETLFSYRRANPTGRFASIIALKSPKRYD